MNGLALVPSRVTQVEFSVSPHPDENTLESYVMKRLAPSDDDAVFVHLLVCEQCRIRCGEAEEFVATLRAILPNKSSDTY